MPVYNYQIETNTGNASGQVETDDKDQAEAQLIEQYLPEKHGFVDDAGKPIKLELVSLEVTEVDQ